jgi:signal peptidase II
MLADAAGWQRWVFVALALAVSVTLIVWLRRLAAATHGLIACGLALIVGGALGNMLDRVRLAHVIDFIHAHWGAYYFPAFNVADSAITVGAGLLLLDAWREARAARRERA